MLCLCSQGKKTLIVQDNKADGSDVQIKRERQRRERREHSVHIRTSPKAKSVSRCFDFCKDRIHGVKPSQMGKNHRCCVTSHWTRKQAPSPLQSRTSNHLNCHLGFASCIWVINNRLVCAEESNSMQIQNGASFVQHPEGVTGEKFTFSKSKVTNSTLQISMSVHTALPIEQTSYAICVICFMRLGGMLSLLLYLVTLALSASNSNKNRNEAHNTHLVFHLFLLSITKLKQSILTLLQMTFLIQAPLSNCDA